MEIIFSTIPSPDHVYNLRRKFGAISAPVPWNLFNSLFLSLTPHSHSSLKSRFFCQFCPFPQIDPTHNKLTSSTPTSSCPHPHLPSTLGVPWPLFQPFDKLQEQILPRFEPSSPDDVDVVPRKKSRNRKSKILSSEQLLLPQCSPSPLFLYCNLTL